MGSDARVNGEICRGGRKPTASASPATPGKAGRAVAEVGGPGSSDDAVLDLWWSGENTAERSGVTCSAVEKSGEGRGDGPHGLPTPDKVRELQITLYRKAKAARRLGRLGQIRERNSESRMRENRPSGLMRGGKQTVIGLATHPVASRLLYTASLGEGSKPGDVTPSSDRREEEGQRREEEGQRVHVATCERSR